MRSDCNAEVDPAAPGEFRPLALGPLRVWPPVVLAPMAGVTDIAFRTMCARRRAPLCVSEMLTARALVEGHESTWNMTRFGPEEPLRSLQLYSTDPHALGQAVAAVIERRSVQHIDLNFGCPAAKVTRHGGGAALPFKRRLFAQVVTAAVNAAGPVPVTVKFRIGLDDDHPTFVDAGRIAADLGVAAVALHARTAYQHYAPPAHWEYIARLRDEVPATVPVLGNGDIWEAWDALRMMRLTGCDGVVIGRGCLGRPWLFGQLAEVFDGRDAGPAPDLPEVGALIAEHARTLVELSGEGRLPSFRKHVPWYLKGYPAGVAARSQVGGLTTLDDVASLVAALPPGGHLPPEGFRLARSHTSGPRELRLPQGWLCDPDEDIAAGRIPDALVSGG